MASLSVLIEVPALDAIRAVTLLFTAFAAHLCEHAVLGRHITCDMSSLFLLKCPPTYAQCHVVFFVTPTVAMPRVPAAWDNAPKHEATWLSIHPMGSQQTAQMSSGSMEQAPARVCQVDGKVTKYMFNRQHTQRGLCTPRPSDRQS
eukprot:5301066-Amphidinium_carterae.2